MRSIGTRLAAWYALAATVTLACLFVVGYQLLEPVGEDVLLQAYVHEP